MYRASKSIIALVFGIAVNSSLTASAQISLEKLEQTVREGLKQPSASKKNTQQGELPAPAEKSAPSKPSQATPSLELPGISVLEAPIVPAPTSGNTVSAEPVVARGYLGLEAEPLVGGGIGVRVATVADGSPAWKAGIKNGDVIRGIDGYAIADLDGMVSRLAKRSPGQAVKFLVSRGDRNLDLTAVLQDTAAAGRIHGSLSLGTQPGNDVPLDASAPGWLGLSVSNLSPEFRLQFGIGAYRGAAVTGVMAGSPAESAMIKPGDAIVEISGRAVDSSQDVLEFVAQSKPGQVADLLVFRGSTPRPVRLVLGLDPKIASSRAAGFFPPNPFQVQPDQTTPTANSTSPADVQKEVRALREELRKNREQLNNIERRLDQLLDVITQPGN